MAYIEDFKRRPTILDRFRVFRWAKSRPTPQCSGTANTPAVRIEPGTLNAETKRDVGIERAYQDYSGSVQLSGASVRRSFDIADAAAWMPR